MTARDVELGLGEQALEPGVLGLLSEPQAANGDEGGRTSVPSPSGFARRTAVTNKCRQHLVLAGVAARERGGLLGHDATSLRACNLGSVAKP